jgi:hypothetical protein
MNETLHPILVLLDEGLSLYRRHFAAFVLIAAGWCVPVGLVGALIVIGATWLDDPMVTILVALAALALLFPLTLYLIGGLSRAALAASEGQPVRFRTALALPPLRMLGVALFSLIYSFISQMLVGALSMAITCPSYLLVLAMGVAVSSAVEGDAGSMLVGFVVLLLFLLIYTLSLALSGGAFSSLVYAIQPWVQGQRPFAEALQQSIDMLVYRFWRNLLTWCLASVILTGVGLTVVVTVGVLLPLPLSFALGGDSALLRAVSICAWAIGGVVVLPPLPIWMALLYRRNRAAYEGAELGGLVQDWARRQQGPPEPPSEAAPGLQGGA